MPQLAPQSNSVIAPSGTTPDTRVLDYPIWNALSSEHACFALGDGLARRYPPEIGPLSGLVEQSAEAYEALRALTGAGGVTAQFLVEPPVERPDWSMVRGGLMSQMIWSGEVVPPTPPLSGEAVLRSLMPADVSAMVELAHLTEPGPFGRRTSELGTFFGIFEAGRLLAMAGQRMRLPGFIEVSAVCTHPDARVRGYARAVMSAVLGDIVRRGLTPILHVFAANHSAIRVYEGLGFTHRRSLHLAVLKAE
jgi:ribosomal protein S18 acetylase RimI-like enzyme